MIGAFALSVIFGSVAGTRWSRRTGIVLAAVVFSHWLLDLIVHRADMPILPGNAGNLPRLGFGLWRRHPVAAMAAELAIVLAGAYFYWRAVHETVISSSAPLPRRRVMRRFSFWPAESLCWLWISPGSSVDYGHHPG
jgi:hypothetical protein